MIVLDDVGKGYRSKSGKIQWIFRHAEGRFPKGQSVGVFGGPGQGKTTLVNLVAGAVEPTEGTIYRRNRISWPFGFRGNVHGHLTGHQNLRFLTDIYGRDFGSAAKFISDFASMGESMDIPMVKWSGQLRNRFLVALFFAMDFQWYLIDGDFLVGQTVFNQQCIDYIEANRDDISFFIASGNIELVKRYCKSAGVLHNGKLIFYDTVEEAEAVFRGIYHL